MGVKRTGSSKNFLISLFIFIGKPIYYFLVIVFTFVPIGFGIIPRILLQIIKLLPLILTKIGSILILCLLFILQSLFTILIAFLQTFTRTITYSYSKLIDKLKSLKPPSFRFPSFTLPLLPPPRLAPFPTFILLTFASALTLFYWFILKDLPDPKNLTTRDQIVTTKIYDRHGQLLFKIYKNENRSLIDLNDIPPHLKLATIAIEDSNFYHHSGLSFRGIARAITTNITENKLQGGSTITQQLVKNALLNPEKTLTRKLKEITLAFLVELNFTKDEILAMYFNEVGYGGATYGIEEASQLYFNKSARDVNLAEAALLAGLPAAPTIYSPFGTNPELSIARQHEVLRRMTEEHFITPQQADEAKAYQLVFAPQTTNIQAPHFVMYVKDLLVQQYGETLVHQGGLEVITSLDLNLQHHVEAAVTSEIDKLQSLNINNAAALVTNPQTGEILAMVGSRDYFDTTNDGQVNVTLRPRQPGSSIKPVNYAVALQNGFTPATIIPDTPICYRVPGQQPYCPKNYDGRFHGNIILRQALASSYNVPAVKTLSQFGVSQMIKQGQAMGITTWGDPSRFGLSLTLGGGEVKMVDMAVVYGTLANLGLKVSLNPILKVTNYHQKTLFALDCSSNSIVAPVEAKSSTTTCPATRVLDPNIAYQLTDILSDNLARAPAFGLHSILNLSPHQVAVKTGTTNNLRDNWAIGYTTNRLVAVWVGNNDNSPMSYVASGITGASPIWNKIMSSLLANQPTHAFTPPSGLKKIAICSLTGTRTCSACPSTKEEYFLPGTEPQTFCSQELIDQILAKKQASPDQILQGLSTSN